MALCAHILVRIERFVFLVLEIIEEVVKTVCGWVTTIVRTVREVTEKVCKWLPWPLDKLCDLVTKLVEVVEEVVEWVCEEVLIRIIRYVRTLIRYVFYVLRWICWLVEWVIRFFLGLLPCLIGVRVAKQIPICVRLGVDEDGATVVSPSRLNELLDGARTRLAQCGIELCVGSVEMINLPDDISSFTCDAGGFFSKHHQWFEENRCLAHEATATTLTVFVIPEYEGHRGCAIPRTDYIVIGSDAGPATIAHEIGHHADLLHSDDPNNVMVDPTTESSTEFTSFQCCMLRTARFATTLPLKACLDSPIDRRLVEVFTPRG